MAENDSSAAKYEFFQKLIWPATFLGAIGLVTVTGYNPLASFGNNNPDTTVAAQSGQIPQFAGTRLSQQQVIDAAAQKVQQQLQIQLQQQLSNQQTTVGAVPTQQQPSFSAPQTQPKISAQARQAIRPPQSMTQGDSTFEIKDASMVQNIVTALSKLKSAKDSPDKSLKAPLDQAYVFFDPRCPFCHTAWDAMKGKIAASWVPVAVLGNPADGNKKVRAIIRGGDTAMLEKVFSNQPLSAAETDDDPALAKSVTENLEAFAMIIASTPGQNAAVPLILIPRADGGMTVHYGFNPGDEARFALLLKRS